MRSKAMFQQPHGESARACLKGCVEEASVKFPLLLPLTVIGAFAISCGRAQTTPEEVFWKWFEHNENSLFDFEKDRERTFGQLSGEMHKLNPNLTFEFGPKEDGRREFVISADGIRDAFPEVEALYGAAPSLPRWKFTKFRPRRKPSDISYAGTSVKAASVSVQVKPNGQMADMTVYIPGYTQAAHKTYAAIAFLFLDQALGEYDVEIHVGQVNVESASKAPLQTYSLEALPKVVDATFVHK
jgi:hypothetical protein